VGPSRERPFSSLLVGVFLNAIFACATIALSCLPPALRFARQPRSATFSRSWRATIKVTFRLWFLARPPDDSDLPELPERSKLISLRSCRRRGPRSRPNRSIPIRWSAPQRDADQLNAGNCRRGDLDFINGTKLTYHVEHLPQSDSDVLAVQHALNAACKR